MHAGLAPDVQLHQSRPATQGVAPRRHPILEESDCFRFVKHLEQSTHLIVNNVGPVVR